MKATRLQHLSGVRMVVVKLGSQILCDKEGRLDPAFIGHMASQVATLQQRGVKVTLVSSGAVAAGLRELNLPKRPTDLAKLQAVAADVDEALRDLDYGDWRGRRFIDLQGEDPAGLAAWMADPSQAAPGGESLQAAGLRLGRWLAAQAQSFIDFVASPQGQAVLSTFGFKPAGK